jgi:hypothetical protein
MAISFQQQALIRKLSYGALILLLFLCGWLLRRYIIEKDAEKLAIREQHRGEVELIGAVVRQSLIGSRGFVTCYLWIQMQNQMKRNQWTELEVTGRALTNLQPHYIHPWLFQSWNLAYNVSVEADRVNDRYFFITRGIQMLAKGERTNNFDPDLRWNMGFFLEHKICQSDDTNTLRSLLQLSCIPPNQRDPARFWVMKNGHLQVDMKEFEVFCREHPHLVRRLKDGIMRELYSDIKRQFICQTPEAVVKFLADNYRVPSMYCQDDGRDIPPWPVPWQQDKNWLKTEGRAEREAAWNQQREELKRLPEPKRNPDLLARFPVLPPPPDGDEKGERKWEHPPADLRIKRDVLHDLRPVADDDDGFALSRSWFVYAQEPVPAPGPTPGSSEPITDRRRQRRPRRMMTILFRQYPALAQQFSVERLQDEAWYDGKGWDIPDWFRAQNNRFSDGKRARVGQVGEEKDNLPGGAQVGWQDALYYWTLHGEANHVKFASEPDEQATRDKAQKFWRTYRLPEMTAPPIPPDELKTEEDRTGYEAARFLVEYDKMRSTSNYPAHYAQALAESKSEINARGEKVFPTVRARQLFHEARRQAGHSNYLAARTAYEGPEGALALWKKVLVENKDFRNQSTTQELTFDMQLRYLRLLNRLNEEYQDRHMAQVAMMPNTAVGGTGLTVSLVLGLPRIDPDHWQHPLFGGPFDEEVDGRPLISETTRHQVLTRLFPNKKYQQSPPPPGTGKPTFRPDRPGPDHPIPPMTKVFRQ